MTKRFLRIYLAFAIIEIIVSIILPSIPIKMCDYNTNIELGLRYNNNCPAYDMGYNVFGVMIYLNRSRTYRQFVDDYSDALEYLYNKHDFPRFNYNNRTLSYYDTFSSQVYQKVVLPPEHIDEEVLEKLLDVSAYAGMCLNGTWKGSALFREDVKKAEQSLVIFNIIVVLLWIVLFAVYCRKR